MKIEMGISSIRIHRLFENYSVYKLIRKSNEWKYSIFESYAAHTSRDNPFPSVDSEFILERLNKQS